MKNKYEKEIFEAFPKLYRGKNEDITESLMGMGLGVGDGWKDIIYNLSENITEYCKKNDYNIPEIVQVKEKFGGLRFYLESYPDEKIRNMIRKAESESFQTCEECGKEGEKRSGSWIKTLCDEHARERGYID